MTNQEAIRILNKQRNEFMDKWVDFGGVNEAYDIAIQALKEHEAVRPEPIMGTSVCDCEKCKHAVAPGMNYCPSCGCPIDWS